MSKFHFTPATKTASKLRLAILGPTGAGKTYTALSITAGRKVAVIDSEHGSAAKYADRFRFDSLNLPDLDPRTYVEAIKAAESAGYEVIIIDSMSHAWKATQDLVDMETTRSKSGNSFQAWGKVGPLWADLIQAIVTSRCHVIATIRSKIEWVIEEDSRGKKVPRKIGTKPEARDGAEYEFDVVLELDQEHNAWTTKTRCPDLDGRTWKNPKADDFGAALFGWLESGAPAPVVTAAPSPAKEATQQKWVGTTPIGPPLGATIPAPVQAATPVQPTPEMDELRKRQTAEYQVLAKDIKAAGGKTMLDALLVELRGAPAADILDRMRGLMETLNTPNQKAD